MWRGVQHRERGKDVGKRAEGTSLSKEGGVSLVAQACALA
jgi:hypothetical protein